MKIEAKYMPYFNRQCLMPFIDGIAISNYLTAFSERCRDLWPAWLGLDNPNEARYLRELLIQEVDGNMPLLVCPDDMDLSCTTIVVQIQASEKEIIWKNCGLLKWEKWDFKAWENAGFRQVETWCLDDWENHWELAYYGLQSDWDRFFSEHWSEEEQKRLRNYYHPYINYHKNVDWFNIPEMHFERADYYRCVNEFLIQMTE